MGGPPELDDDELAGDIVGVTSARLLAAGIPRGDRLFALRLLSVLTTAADAEGRLRRPVLELAAAFDLPSDRIAEALDHLTRVGADRIWADALLLAGSEPPRDGLIRLHDFLANAEASWSCRPPS